LTECQFPAYSALKPIHIGGGGRFVNFYRTVGRIVTNCWSVWSLPCENENYCCPRYSHRLRSL